MSKTRTIPFLPIAPRDNILDQQRRELHVSIW